MILLALLGEYYFNNIKWSTIIDSRYAYNNLYMCDIFELTQIRYELTNSELSWVSYFYNFFNMISNEEDIYHFYKNADILKLIFTNIKELYTIKQNYYNKIFIINPILNVYYNHFIKAVNPIITNIDAIKLYISYNFLNKQITDTSRLFVSQTNINYLFGGNITYLYSYIITNVKNNCNFILGHNMLIYCYLSILNMFHNFLTNEEKYDFIKSLFISINNLNDINKEKELLIKACLSVNLLLEDVFLIYENNTISDRSCSSNIISYYINNNNKNIKNGYYLSTIYERLFDLIHNLFQKEIVNDNNIIDAIKSIKFKLDYPYIKTIEDNKIEYIIDNNKYTNIIKRININFNDYILANFISSKSYNIYLTETHIIFEAEIDIDINNKKPIFYAFDINIMENKIIIKNKNIYINSKKYKLTDDKKKYTFVSVLPYLTINFISFDNDNNISTHSIGIDKSTKSSQLYQCIFDRQSPISDKLYPALIELEIKPNYLIPYIDETNFKYINSNYKFYKKYSNFLSVFNNEDLVDFNLDQTTILLPSIEKILLINDANIDEILHDIINHNLIESTNLNLIEWIDITNYNQDYGKQNNICSTDCTKAHTKPVVDKINNFLIILKKIRKYIANKCVHDINFKLLNFINNNFSYCSLLMQTNIYITKLLRLKEIITDCISLSCHEIAEINELFIRKKNNIKLLPSMVEIVFGNIIREEQWDKIYNIYLNYESSISNIHGHNRIHQFMMGKGKSSLITPMLTVLLFKEQNVNIVVPEHLIKQTKETLYEYKHFFGINPNIISDTNIKLLFLEQNTSNTNFNDNIYLIDEFDYMYNPLQSNFNIIEESKYIDRHIINKVFYHVMLFLNKKTTVDYPEYSLERDIMSILRNKSYVKYKNYGMSIKYDYRYCIPYLRKDSPNEGSQFSSNIITIVLTILYFYDEDKGFLLEDRDIKLLFTKSKLILKKILAYFDITNFSSLEDILYQFNQKNYSKSIHISPNVFLEYLHVVFYELNESTLIKNCSFIDIINMNSKWQVGYSGTVNVNLEIEPIIPWNKYNMKVIEDPDEKINVITALNNNQDVYSIKQNSYDELFNKLKDFDVVIDACSFFKDIDNTEVAKRLSEMSNKPVIYLLKDDTKMIYNNKPQKYVYKSYKKGEVIYYYSHRHIIGIDFKQSVLLNGVVILDKNNKYTEVAQAIYRMRKLNKGHTINIIMVDNESWNASNVIKLLEDNEKLYEENVKPLLNYQYLKYFVRKFITHNYFETDLEPLYNMPKENIKNNTLIKQICKKKIMNNIITSGLADRTKTYRYYINELYKQISRTSLDVLVNLVFNLNTTEVDVKKQTTTEVEEEVEEEQEQEVEAVVQMSAVVNKSIADINRIKVLYYMNPFKSVNEFEEFVYLKIKLEKITLMFSVNLVNNLGCNNECILIELDENIYLVDSSISLDHYILIRPVYNMDGYLINKYVFSQNNKYIDFKEIFNFSVILIGGEEIPICDILFDTFYIPKMIKKKKVSYDNKKSLKIVSFEEKRTECLHGSPFKALYRGLYNKELYNNINIIDGKKVMIDRDYKFKINNNILKQIRNIKEIRNIKKTQLIIVPTEIIVKLKILIALSKVDVFNKSRPYMQELKKSGMIEIEKNPDNILLKPINIDRYYVYIKHFYINTSKERFFIDNNLLISNRPRITSRFLSLQLIYFSNNLDKYYYLHY